MSMAVPGAWRLLRVKQTENNETSKHLPRFNTLVLVCHSVIMLVTDVTMHMLSGRLGLSTRVANIHTVDSCCAAVPALWELH